MERSIHPDLVKRTVIPSPDGGDDRVQHLSGMSLLRLTRHDPVPAREQLLGLFLTQGGNLRLAWTFQTVVYQALLI